MDIFKILTQFFRKNKQIFQTSKPNRNREQVTKDLVARHAEGSVCLYLGAYMTEEETETMKKEVFDHNFYKSSKKSKSR